MIAHCGYRLIAHPYVSLATTAKLTNESVNNID